jgi:hypothetical protein
MTDSADVLKVTAVPVLWLKFSVTRPYTEVGVRDVLHHARWIAAKIAEAVDDARRPIDEMVACFRNYPPEVPPSGAVDTGPLQEEARPSTGSRMFRPGLEQEQEDDGAA